LSGDTSFFMMNNSSCSRHISLKIETLLNTLNFNFQLVVAEVFNLRKTHQTKSFLEGEK